MGAGVARGLERDQVQLGIFRGVAAEFLVVDLQV
jgi:hypothetical protein